MSIKKLIEKLRKAEELNPLEQAELERFDPDALMAEAETLRKECAELHEADRLARRREKMRRITEETGCLEPEYLDFRLQSAGVDPGDDKALESFLQDFIRENPRYFQARIRPGSTCTGDGAKKSSAPERSDRIGRIISSLDSAPDA